MGASGSNKKHAHTPRVVDSGSPFSSDFAEREQRFLEKFPNDLVCLDHLMQMRFGSRIKCPKCARTAKFHKIRQIPAFACQWCGYHLHPMAQTRFARSRVGPQVWFHAVFLFSCGNNGISARNLQRMLGLTYKTAWRIRNTIIDVKFYVPRHATHEGRVDFDDLLAALLAPARDSPSAEVRN